MPLAVPLTGLCAHAGIRDTGGRTELATMAHESLAHIVIACATKKCQSLVQLVSTAVCVCACAQSHTNVPLVRSPAEALESSSRTARQDFPERLLSDLRHWSK